MRIDAYTHFFPKRFFDKLIEIAGDYKDMGKRVRAIALTAYAREEDRARTIDAGFMRHLSKPVEPGKLCDIIADVAKEPI